jgi:hypothetical protein
VDELQPFGFDDPLDLLLHMTRYVTHFRPYNKKSGRSAAFESLLLESRRILTHHSGRDNTPGGMQIPI